MKFKKKGNAESIFYLKLRKEHIVNKGKDTINAITALESCCRQTWASCYQKTQHSL